MGHPQLAEVVMEEGGSLPVMSGNLPLINNKWIMQILEAENYGTEELIQLNRVRCYQQVRFLSDALPLLVRARGNCLTKKIKEF